MRFSRSADEYAPIAKYYDAIIGPFVKPIRQEVCRLAQAGSLRRVVDICCGTGEQAILLAELGFRVTGIDLSPSMLQVARSSSPASIDYHQEDAANLHFDDNAFDGAVISLALHEKSPETRSRILSEARRVIRPRGKLIVVDYISPRNMVSAVGAKLIGMVEWLAGSEHHGFFKEFMRAGGTEPLLKKHGLDVLELRTYHLGSIGVFLACSP